MNKIMIIGSIILCAFFIHLGISLNANSVTKKDKYVVLVKGNEFLKKEISFKESLKKSSPVSINESFNVLVNQMRILESYSGTKMNLLTLKDQKQSLESRFQDSIFKKVRMFPVSIQIEKYSNETDLTSVLNDIYILEKQTDFKVMEISMENNSLSLKGELYGI
jgi:hypothetical protein